MAIAFAGFVGGVFVYVGLRSISGTANYTLAYGIGSIILGVYIVLGGIASALATDFLGPGGFVLAGILLPIGAGLLVAGILTIQVRGQYKAWRRARKETTLLRSALINRAPPALTPFRVAKDAEPQAPLDWAGTK